MIELKADEKRVKKFYCEVVGECEQCGKKDGLEVHRILPGYKGGTYIPRNCQILCKDCHKMRAEEW